MGINSLNKFIIRKYISSTKKIMGKLKQNTNKRYKSRKMRVKSFNEHAESLLNKYVSLVYMKHTQKLRNGLKRILPYPIVRGIRIIKTKSVIITNRIIKKIFHFIFYHFQLRPVTKKNIVLRNKHKGQRCFILGSGPSINTQDISILKNETCICLNNFHLHKDYSLLEPNYHLINSVVAHIAIHNFSETETFNKISDFFASVEKNISTKTKLLLHYPDYYFIKKNHFFSKNKIHYYGSSGKIEKFLTHEIDLTKEISEYYQSLIATIEIAIYMGFKNIYLLGIDHNYYFPKYFENQANNSAYFYEKPSESIGKIPNFNAEYVDLLWKQYYILKKISEQKKINIFNTNPESHLDIFPFIVFENLFIEQKASTNNLKKNHEYSC